MSGRRLGLSAPILLVLLIVGAAGATGARQLWRSHMEERLLATWPESAARDPDLVRFATARAVPVLAEHCAVCHGAGLHGDTVHGTPDLVDAEWIYGEGRVADIEQTVNHGIRSGDHRGHELADMPGFIRANPYARYRIAPLKRAEIDDLVAFVLRLSGRPGDAAAAARGGVLFVKAQCDDCHTASAQGDPGIGAPSLRRHDWLFGSDAAALADVISYGRAGICPAWFGRLPPATIRAIAIYLRVRSEHPS